MTSEQYRDFFHEIKQNAIVVDCIPADGELAPLASKFGGTPDLPWTFNWPYCAGNDAKGDVWEELQNMKPLSFLAQFNLEELAACDKEGRLPHKGMLYFFYDLHTRKLGYDPEDRDCGRVYYIEDTSNLEPYDPPTDLEEEYQLSEFSLQFSCRTEVPDYDEICEHRSDMEWDLYKKERKKCGFGAPNEDISKLLGYADVVLNGMPLQCAEIENGLRCRHLNFNTSVPEPEGEELEKLLEESKDWTMLFQMSNVPSDDYELWLAEGKIYFYIKKQDLQEKNFDNVCVILQSEF